MSTENPYLALARQAMDRIPHNRALGVELVALARGRATARLPGRETFCGDPQRRLYFPSVLLTLADGVCGVAFISSLGGPAAVATLDLRIDYLRPVSVDTALVAEAHCYRHTARIGFLRCEIRAEGAEAPAAMVNASFMHTGARAEAA